MKKVLLFSTIIASMSVLTGCFEKADEVTPSAQRTASYALNSTTCLPTVTELYAGQHHLAGNVTVFNDSTNVYVTVNTIDGWQLGLTHLFVGALSDLPATPKGNPKIGNFPYQTKHDPRITSYTYSIPLSTLNGEQCLAIAFHAEAYLVGEDGSVIKKETAWGSGPQMAERGSWAMYFEHCLCAGSGNNGNNGSGGN